MRDWHIELSALGGIPLSADPRLNRRSFPEDHIWCLTSQNVQPPALTFLTRFGLQSHAYQIFPIFKTEENEVRNPECFFAPPLIRSFTTNLLKISFEPWKDLQASVSYWVPERQVSAGAFTMTNTRSENQRFQFHLAAVLHPLGGGQSMKASRVEGRTVLSGKSGNLHPLLFLTGGPREGMGVFPNLSLEFDLPPQGSETLRWVSSSLNSPEESFQLTQSIMKRTWEAAFARTENLWEGQLQIYTGDPMWDLACALSQKLGFGSVFDKDEKGRYYFQDRRLDIGRVSDNGPEKNLPSEEPGLTALESVFLADLVSPGSPNLLESLLNPFLQGYKENGFVGFRSPPGKEDADLLASPFLLRLAWKVFKENQDFKYLESAYPALIGYLDLWFSKRQDRDADGAPEWSRVRQVECSAHPANPGRDSWLHFPHIPYAESPALCALLIAEIDNLLEICDRIQEKEAVQVLQNRKQALTDFVHRSWSAEQAQYQRWDRTSHHFPVGEELQKGQGPGLMILKKKLAHASRLVLHFQSPHPLSPKTKIFLHGEGEDQKHWVENIPIHQIYWNHNRGKATSKHIYTYLEYVVAYNLAEDVKISVETANFQTDDILLLLPLWSKTALPEQAQALIQRKIGSEEAFWGSYGLRSGIKPKNPTLLPSWNSMIGDGLLAYGAQTLAAELFQNFMKLIIKNMTNSKSFYGAYDSKSGKGIGQPYRITGAVPIGFFLKVLGVDIHNNHEVFIRWGNPYPWPVKLEYRGLTVIHEKEETILEFAGGQKTVIEDQNQTLVRLG
ncbi:MAG: hypothetical protein R6U51_05985 [Anaerolineales bacterium]